MADHSYSFVHVNSKFSNTMSFLGSRIYDIIFSPNGSYILVAAGNLILVTIHLTIHLQTKQTCLKEGCGSDFHSLFTKWTKLY